MLYRAHREASHPDYVQWGRRKVRLSIYVLFSWFALFVVDALFGRFLTPDFLFAGVVAYVLGTLIVAMLVERRKIRELSRRQHRLEASNWELACLQNPRYD